MKTIRRKIITIDEDKCNGCGVCVPACAEGALQIIDGKVKLVSEVYCDGLGACLGECPQGAIRMEEREAPAFDEEATARHVAQVTRGERTTPPACPSMAFAAGNVATAIPGETVDTGPMLSNWPVQLGLVPPGAPFLQDADVVLAADCTAYAYGGFHSLLGGRPLIVACPKLDDVEAHLERLTAILQQSSVRSLTIVRMEVPCCSGLVRVAMEAVKRSGREIPVEVMVIGVKGTVQMA